MKATQLGKSIVKEAEAGEFVELFSFKYIYSHIRYERENV